MGQRCFILLELAFAVMMSVTVAAQNDFREELCDRILKSRCLIRLHSFVRRSTLSQIIPNIIIRLGLSIGLRHMVRG